MKKKSEQTDDLTTARAKLDADRQARAMACANEIAEVMKKYNCIEMFAVTIRSDGQVVPSKQIMAVDVPGSRLNG